MMRTSEAVKVVLDFLIEENRPFSTQDIVEKCGKSFGKALVQKSLNSLMKSNRISEKSIGKLKIYYATQKIETLELKQEVQRLKQSLSQTQNLLKNKLSQYRQLEAQLKNMPRTRSIESLKEERDKLLDEIRGMNEELRRHEIVAAETKITPDEAKKIQRIYENATSAYRKRKRICNDMLEAILEGYPKPKKQLMEDIGVETDEAVGFSVVIKKL